MTEADQFVDPVVTRAKFRRELQQWREHGRSRERGWILLNADEEQFTAEIAFTARVALSAGSGPASIVVCAVRLDYTNYDVVPPSLTFIDFLSSQPAVPHVGAFVATESGLRNVLIGAHPHTQHPFLCVPGIREYHSHPQHSGDDWLLHRSQRAGSLLTVSERVWRFMAQNVVGLSVTLQGLPTWPLKAQLQIQLTQGNVTGAVVQPRESPPQEEVPTE